MALLELADPPPVGPGEGAPLVAEQLALQEGVRDGGAVEGQKRGGGAARIELDEAAILSPEQSKEIVDLDEALERLATLDSRKARVVELKFFGGLNYDEIAEVLKIARRTARRDWEFARIWLYRELHSVD